MPTELDAYEIKILELLQADATLSTTEIAERVGLSQSPCWRRIQRLREEGIIRREAALLDRQKIGLGVTIFAQVKLSTHGRQHLAEFTDAISAFPQVLECHVLLGAVDFLLRIVAEDMAAYERFFFDELSRLPGVQEVNSTVVVSEIKYETALPLNHLRKTA